MGAASRKCFSALLPRSICDMTSRALHTVSLIGLVVVVVVVTVLALVWSNNANEEMVLDIPVPGKNGFPSVPAMLPPLPEIPSSARARS